MSEQSEYRVSIRADRLLNEAILSLNIGENYEDYLAIFDKFYADGIQASIEGPWEEVFGKAAVRQRVAAFLMPLHSMVEVGGVTPSLQIEPVTSDTRNETHSVWTLKLTAITGKLTVLRWRVCRRWDSEHVINEKHSDIQQTGGPLTEHDLQLFPQVDSLN